MDQSHFDQTEDAPLTVQTERGVSVYWKNRYLYSKIAPETTANRLACHCPITPKTLYLLPSPLLGYGIIELTKKIDSESILLLIEKEPALIPITQQAVDDLLQKNRLLKKTGRRKTVFYTIFTSTLH